MPARKRTLSTLAVPALVAALAAGCGLQQGPSSYGEGVQQDFVTNCVKQQLDPSATVDVELDTSITESTDPDSTAATERCQCAYNNLSENIDFDEFKSANDELDDNPGGTLPPALLQQVEACGLADGSATAPPAP